MPQVLVRASVSIVVIRVLQFYETVRARLGPHVRDLVFERGTVDWPMVSPAHMWRLFRTRYGPTMKALESSGGDAGRTPRSRGSS